jgi:hypothetical protein
MLYFDVQIPTKFLRLSFTKTKQIYMDNIDEWQFLQRQIVQPLC